MCGGEAERESDHGRFQPSKWKAGVPRKLRLTTVVKKSCQRNGFSMSATRCQGAAARSTIPLILLAAQPEATSTGNVSFSLHDHRLPKQLRNDPAVANRLVDQAVHFTRACQNGFGLVA